MMRVAQFETNNKNLATLINEWLVEHDEVYVVDIKYNTIPTQYGITYSALMLYLPSEGEEQKDEGIDLDQITIDDVLKSLQEEINSGK